MKEEVFLCLAQTYVFPPELMFCVCVFVCLFAVSAFHLCNWSILF